MKTRLIIAAALTAAALAAAGCASTPNVRVVSDPTADFTQYRTFGFANPLGTDRGGYQLSPLHISEPTRLWRSSYAVFCLKKKKSK